MHYSNNLCINSLIKSEFLSYTSSSSFSPEPSAAAWLPSSLQQTAPGDDIIVTQLIPRTPCNFTKALAGWWSQPLFLPFLWIFACVSTWTFGPCQVFAGVGGGLSPWAFLMQLGSFCSIREARRGGYRPPRSFRMLAGPLGAGSATIPVVPLGHPKLGHQIP